jgi:diaminohydroxyphosphoribosylaminopyrimidine deaminase/5-amino-6-(5-phosphoribosylamino)uracil reductase
MDSYFMKRALGLAKKGLGYTSPNPMVGAVIVQDGLIVGEGFHRKAGTEHAEIVALETAGNRAKGGTLYVNLEPCCHTNKRTPPCTDAIIQAGIQRVVVGMIDPNPAVSGQGARILHDKGIAVDVGLFEQEARTLNEVFIKYITTQLPFVTLKTAQSLDGKIATSTYQSKWITGETARAYVQRLRHQYDAILIGVNTALKDDPSLTARIEGGIDPTRIIVDSRLRIPLSAKVFNQASSAQTIIATTSHGDGEKIKQLEALNVKVLVLPDKDNRVDLKALTVELGKMGVTSILIEGGSSINGSALKEGIVDKAIVFIAPMLIGGQDAIGFIGGDSPLSLSLAKRLSAVVVKKLGDDLMIQGYVRNESV